MSIKGFSSQKKLLEVLDGYTAAESQSQQDFVTIQNIGSDKRALDSVLYGVYNVSANNAIASGSTKRIIKKVAHGARIGDLVRFVDGDNIGISLGVLSTPDADTIILASELIDVPTAGELFDVQRYVATKYNSDGSQIITFTPTYLDVVDQIDATPLLSVALTNIPASSGNPVQIVASLAADCKKIVSVEDIGEFIGLYTGAALSETLKCILPLGGGEMDVEIAAGTRISLRHMKNTAITSDYISINFLG